MSEIATKYHLTPAQVLLKYTQQKGYIALTTTSKRDRVVEYLSNKEITLSKEEVQSIDNAGLLQHKRKYWSNCFAITDKDAGLL